MLLDEGQKQQNKTIKHYSLPLFLEHKWQIITRKAKDL